MKLLKELYDQVAIEADLTVNDYSAVIELAERVPALPIFGTSSGNTVIKGVANKWKFQDTIMGEQFITLTISSEKPIEWEIGDYCEFRGEIFTLNYIPSVTQKAKIGQTGEAFVYDSVKFDSRQEELTRCIMLDITPTTGDYVAALGTNYTGSSRFPLFCGETSVELNGHTEVLTPVCALAAKIQANLDRMFPHSGWHVYVDTTTTYTTSTGLVLPVTHTDDKMLSFDNTTVAQALAEVNNTFDLNYCVRGRNIYIGYALNELTSDDENGAFSFGFGKGYPKQENPDSGLFQIKQIANSQQKIVTRLRALGSTKNLPYRYYNKRYGGEDNKDLTQTLFPVNLQLPGTFLPEGEKTDAANPNGSTKWSRNNSREESLRAVKGDTNDSYIDKNDDAESCKEGVREDSARWDGSNGELPEIYPTIEGMTFGDLRNAGVYDQTGETGPSAFQGQEVQPNTERIDNILAVGYTSGGVLYDDANIGDGIMSEEGATDSGSTKPVTLGYVYQSYKNDFTYTGRYYEGKQRTLLNFPNVSAGRYILVPTGPSYDNITYFCTIGYRDKIVSANVGFVLRVIQKPVDGSAPTTIATYVSEYKRASRGVPVELYLPELPDARQGESSQVDSLSVTEFSKLTITIAPYVRGVNLGDAEDLNVTFSVGESPSNPSEYDPEYTLVSENGSAGYGSFHVFVKDMGFVPSADFSGDTPVVAMKSGSCIGREFEVGGNVQAATVNGKRGYLLTLNRVKDETLNVYFPSTTNPIKAGDYFVLLGIAMPDAYVQMAEAKLLRAASDYLADNCETKYTYQPSIDNLYLQRNYEKMAAEGRKEDSIFWRLYSGLKFLFRGIPTSPNSQPPIVDVTIEQVSITMGEGLTPKVDIVLNDDTQQSTIQRITTAVDRIYNGSAYSTGGSANPAVLFGLLSGEGGKMFLSRINDDVASGKITFKDILTAIDLIKAKGGINIGGYRPGFLGAGAFIDTDGRAEFEEVVVRGSMRAAEFVFNKISAIDGEQIGSIGNGEILDVDTNSCIASLKLDGDEWATIDTGDICRGLFSTIDKDYDNRGNAGFDSNGFRNKQGFFASYFKIEEVLTNAKGECSFRYSLQTDSLGEVITEHPCPLMRFAVYGNADDSKKERQSSIYTTSIGIAPREMFLAGVNDWKIKPENIKIARGNIDGISVWEEVTESEYNNKQGVVGVDKKTWQETVDGQTVTHWAIIRELVGDAGFYCEDNIYLGGIIDQFKSAAMDAINAQLSNVGQAWVSTTLDSFVVDCDENGLSVDDFLMEVNCYLYYGSTRCQITQCEARYNGQTISGLRDGNGWYFAVDFNTGDEVVSGAFEISITGTDSGTTYTSYKSIAIIANRRGATGDSGRGLVSSVTYYKTTMYNEVTLPLSDEDPLSLGWYDTYQEPTELLPYLFRFTRYTYSKAPLVEHTDGELVGVYSDITNPNLLADTDFVYNRMGAWSVKGTEIEGAQTNEYGITASKKYDGHNSFKNKFQQAENGDNVSLLLLEQALVSKDGVKKVEEGKWYTLTFASYANVVDASVDVSLNGIVDNSVGAVRYIDGVEDVATNETAQSFHYYQFKNRNKLNQWVKHSFTFKAKSSLDASESSLCLRFYTQGTAEEYREVYISVPKLELGKMITPYVSLEAEQKVITRQTVWASGKQYFQGAYGEPFLDLVNKDGKWFRCTYSHVSATANQPTEGNNSVYWGQASNFDFISTNVLLAQNGTIDLLSSNAINLFNGVTKTASINYDGKGSYCIYYESGNKMMEFSVKGYIYFYHNNAENSEAWRLGEGGDIKGVYDDDWQPIYLANLPNGLSTIVGSGSTWETTEYFQFNAGSESEYTAYDGVIFTESEVFGKDKEIADGYYTPNRRPTRNGSSYWILIYHIVNGVIATKYQYYHNGTNGVYTEIQ